MSNKKTPLTVADFDLIANLITDQQIHAHRQANEQRFAGAREALRKVGNDLADLRSRVDFSGEQLKAAWELREKAESIAAIETSHCLVEVWADPDNKPKDQADLAAVLEEAVTIAHSSRLFYQVEARN